MPFRPSTVAGASAGAVAMAVMMKEGCKQAKPPRIEMQSTEENKAIINACPELTKPIVPPWGRTGHVTSGIFVMRNAFPIGHGKYEYVKLPDGGSVMLDWYCDSNPAANGTVILFPGLNNSSRTNYILVLAEFLKQAGFNVVGVNYRGVLHEYSSTRFGFANSWKDLPFILRAVGQHICSACDGRKKNVSDADIESIKVFGVGCSMGGSILSRYTLEQEKGESSELFKGLPARPKFTANAFVCPALDIGFVWEWLHKSSTGLAKSFFLASGTKFKHLTAQWHSQTFRKAMDKVGFSNFLLAPFMPQIDNVWVGLSGYRDSKDYYQDVASLHSIGRHENAIPSLIIHAKDDPIVPPSACRPPQPMPRKVIYVESELGGHLAFGSTDLGWANKTIANYFLHFTGPRASL